MKIAKIVEIMQSGHKRRVPELNDCCPDSVFCSKAREKASLRRWMMIKASEI